MPSDTITKAIELMDKINLTIERNELNKSNPNAIDMINNLLSIAQNLLPKINVYHCKLIEV